MPLLQYFGWVGSFLLAALFAVNWCSSSPIASVSVSDVPPDQKINIRIHTNHKWPERVVFDTTRSTLAHEAKAEADPEIGGAQTSVLAERQPFDAFAEMTTPVKPCLRPSCSTGPAERETLPTENGAISSLADNGAQRPHFPQSASQAARKKLTR
jgi:hypothetical protein